MKSLYVLLACTVILFSCSKRVVNFSGELTYLQRFEVLNDTLSEDLVSYYERRYSDTVMIYVSPDGEIRSEGKQSNLGLDFMANISSWKRSPSGYKRIDTVIIYPYYILEDDTRTSELRLHSLSGKEGVVGDSTYDYPYLVNYYTVKDSLHIFKDIQKSFRDYFLNELIIRSKQLPVEYLIETKDFQLTRQLIHVKYSDSTEQIRLTRKLRKQIP